ncbi:TROVE domain-containing protein [Aquimonas sp.]|jgi:60 kDa SS-A/Ro ribonucleoprotein|uniref:vWA domain-containing protein n=1 Tax=Aquimonas sp. TaxID=1872588 RepID=UPI0037C0E9A9
MINRLLFGTAGANALQPADTRNQAGAPAYALSPKHSLAQLAMTGCLNSTYYSDAESQLDALLAACFDVDSRFVARAALHARRHGRMKDTPALLCAYLASFNGELLEQVFSRVIDSGRMLRAFVQILRSGRVARTSLGSQPKRLVQNWLNGCSDTEFIRAMVGQQPSIADVIRMVHPKPLTREREALFAYALGRPYLPERLPPALQAFEAFKRDASQPVPELPFQLLTGLALSPAHWKAIASSCSWTTLRMNLNTFQRHGVFEDSHLVNRLAKRLADGEQVQRAGAFPYQLLATQRAVQDLPPRLQQALCEALQHSVRAVPALSGSLALAVDVSGSMVSPITGHRRGATTAVRCVDVAALFAAALLVRNPEAEVLPFDERVRPWQAPRGGLRAVTESLAGLIGGGTAISAPLEQLAKRRAPPDLVVLFSDNQSWLHAHQYGGTEALAQWHKLKQRNPAARLVCVDLQPYANAQLPERVDVLNIGGFSDAVFERIAEFARGKDGAGHWVERIEAETL